MIYTRRQRILGADVNAAGGIITLTDFTYQPGENQIFVLVNGVFLDIDANEYTESSTNTVTINETLAADDVVILITNQALPASVPPGITSNVPDIVAGVTEALAQTGEPLTIKRVEYVTDPDAPTQPPVATPVLYTCVGYVGPVSQWNPASMQREVTTDCYIDPMSLRNDIGNPVNAPNAITVVTIEGDVVIDGNGKEWRLTQEQHPRIEGQLALFWHRGLA